MGGLILAQSSMDPGTALMVISGAFTAALSLVIWIVRHLFTVLIPEQQKTFREEMKEARNVLDKLSKLQEAIWEMIALVREQQADLTQIATTVSEHTDDLRNMAAEIRSLGGSRPRPRSEPRPASPQPQPQPGGGT